jgi:tRNA-dihydrouridine synthase
MKRYMAPMRGLTEALYRNAFSRHFKGIDMAVSPFITTVSRKISNKHIKDVLPQNNQALPLTPQLLSKDAQGFINMAIKLFDLGYDEINWNLGCPYAMVANKMRGTGLLPYPEIIDRFLETVLVKIPNRLSIKVRLGRYHADEIRTLMPVFNAYPLSGLIIHPRTGVQMYEGTPNLEQFEKCLSVSKNPVIYNGDIRSPSDFTMICKRFSSVDGIMMGRGLLSNPFLGEMIDDSHVQIEIPRLKAFHDDLYNQYQNVLSGPGHVLGKMKEQWKYLSQIFDHSHSILKRIQRTSTFKQYEAGVFDAFLSMAKFQESE